MKIKAIIWLILALAASSAYAQSASDNLKKLADEKEYEKAAAFIPAAIQENRKNVDLMILCGDIYTELDKLDSALIVYRLADDIKGDVPKTMRKIGNTLSLLNKSSEAVKILKAAIKEDQKDIYSYLQLAQIYIRADSLSQAEINITRARELEPKNPTSYIALGDMYYKQRVYELAKDNYEQALSLDENLTEARVKLATSYYWLANREIDKTLSNEYFSRSLQEWNKITKQDPKNAKAFYEQGRILYFSQEYVKSAQSFYEYIKLRPSGYLGRWYLAQDLFELSQCDSALPQLEIVAEKIDSVKLKAEFMLARCYFESKNYPNALRIYDKLSKDTTLDINNLQLYGNAALLTSDTAKAIIVWKQAIELDPKATCKLMYILGTQLNKMKRYDEAVYILNKRIATAECRDTLDPIIYYFIGISYLFAEKSDSALPALKESIKLDSNFMYSHIYLGDVYAKKNEIQNAENEFIYVISNGSKDIEKNKSSMNQAFGKLCGMKLDQKKFSDLIKYSKMWIEIFTDSPYAYLYLAVGYQGSNDKDNACKYYKKVLQLDPKNVPAKRNKEALQCE